MVAPQFFCALVSISRSLRPIPSRRPHDGALCERINLMATPRSPLMFSYAAAALAYSLVRSGVARAIVLACLILIALLIKAIEADETLLVGTVQQSFTDDAGLYVALEPLSSTSNPTALFFPDVQTSMAAAGDLVLVKGDTQPVTNPRIRNGVAFEVSKAASLLALSDLMGMIEQLTAAVTDLSPGMSLAIAATLISLAGWVARSMAAVAFGLTTTISMTAAAYLNAWQWNWIALPDIAISPLANMTGFVATAIAFKSVIGDTRIMLLPRLAMAAVSLALAPMAIEAGVLPEAALLLVPACAILVPTLVPILAAVIVLIEPMELNEVAAWAVLIGALLARWFVLGRKRLGAALPQSAALNATWAAPDARGVIPLWQALRSTTTDAPPRERV